MIVCQTRAEALAVANVVNIDVGPPIVAYQVGDTAPSHLLVVELTPAQVLASLHLEAKALLSADDAVSKKDKAVLLETLGLLVAIAGKFNALQASIAAAISLADLKTRAAVVGTAPTPTVAQAKTAIANRIDAAEADG